MGIAAGVTELRCTYRLQLGPGLGFAEARELVGYLADLGVSHLYLPPSFQARTGSTHGYDVVDPTRISEELGGEEAFRALIATARDAGLGVILDIVPNHMATDDANRYWSDPELRPKFFDVDPQTGFYRRFFDIDHLAGVRQEDPDVFDETHRLALQLVRDGMVDGLRIDHPDGMADPAGYLRRLADRGVERIWVEKILDPGEQLRDWPVEGTVGYEFLNDAAAVFVDPAGQERLTDLHTELTGDRRDFGEIAFEAKLEQASTTFRREVQRLQRLAETPNVERALASLPVYRTYAEPWGDGPSEEDREVLAEAGLPGLYDGKPAEWVVRFQQTTPPVMAKGVEDTAFYRYVRLLALNDVGGDPGRFGIAVDRLHEANARRAERFPRNLLVTQTHDTKRSGDVRARIGALAGIADDFAEHVHRWREVNAELRDGEAPDGNEELLIYQTLVGAWPIEPQRLDGYLEKALREAKRNTSWIDQDAEWEGAVQRFARRVMQHEPFLETFLPFQQRVAALGHRAALGQLLLKLASPGVPDLYQGDELVALSLVDPDNRRQVDWQRRRALLDAVLAGDAGAASADAEKLTLVVRALDLRRRRPEPFAGAYEPVDAGPDCCAFVRGSEVLAVTTLRVSGEDALIAAPGRWRDVVSGAEHAVEGRVRAGELTAGRGYALLERV